MRSALVACGAALVLSLSGCASEWVRPDMPTRSLERLAVLPFLAKADEAERPLAQHHARVLTEIVASRLKQGPYLLLPYDLTRQRLAARGLERPGATIARPISELRELLGVDAVVRGELLESAYLQAGLVFWRSLGYRAEVVDLRDGSVLLTVEHKEVNLGGVLVQATQVVEGIERTLMSHSQLAFVRLAELLADELHALIQPPAKPPAIDKPVIDDAQLLLAREAIPSGARVGPQTRLVVHLRGTPDRLATLRFSDGRTIPLREREPGRYRCVYRFAPGDHSAGARVVLSDAFGAASVRALDLPVDLRPPAAPSKLRAARDHNRVYLSWKSAPDTAGRYVLYAETLDHDLQELARLSTASASTPYDPSVRRYLVASLSAAGLLGPPVWVEAP